jgi:hypothetical protein
MLVEESVLKTSTSGASPCTFTVSGHLRDLERDGELEGLADAEGEAVLLSALEAGELDLDDVAARLEGAGTRGAGLVGDDDGAEAGVWPGHRDGHARQDLVGFVDGDDFDGAVGDLGVCHRRTPRQHRRQCDREAAGAAASECGESPKHSASPEPLIVPVTIRDGRSRAALTGTPTSATNKPNGRCANEA